MRDCIFRAHSREPGARDVRAISHSSATIWTMAEEFGAKCHRHLVKSVTHMVAANVCTCC